MNELDPLIRYHIEETNRRLERIEAGLDSLVETKMEVKAISQKTSLFISIAVSILSAIGAKLSDKLLGKP